MKKILSCGVSLILTVFAGSANCYYTGTAVSPEAIKNEYLRKKTTIDLLCDAIDSCNYELVKHIVNKYKCDVNQRSYNGDLPLYAAVLLSNNKNNIETAKKIVDLLLENGADPEMTHEKGISVLELFTLADRSCFDEIFAKHGFVTPIYQGR